MASKLPRHLNEKEGAVLSQILQSQDDFGMSPELLAKEFQKQAGYPLPCYMEDVQTGCVEYLKKHPHLVEFVCEKRTSSYKCYSTKWREKQEQNKKQRQLQQEKNRRKVQLETARCIEINKRREKLENCLHDFLSQHQCGIKLDDFPSEFSKTCGVSLKIICQRLDIDTFSKFLTEMSHIIETRTIDQVDYVFEKKSDIFKPASEPIPVSVVPPDVAVLGDRYHVRDVRPGDDGLLKIRISNITSPSDIHFIQDKPDWKNLEKLMDGLDNFYNIMEAEKCHVPPSELQISLPCAVSHFDNGKSDWHRAQILSTPKEGSVDVIFVDYGNVAKAHVDTVCYLKKKFMAKPKFAIRAKMCNIKPNNPQNPNAWSPKAANYLLQKLNDIPCIAIVKSMTDGIHSISLRLQNESTGEETCLNDKLIEKGYALRTMEENFTQLKTVSPPVSACLATNVPSISTHAEPAFEPNISIAPIRAAGRGRIAKKQSATSSTLLSTTEMQLTKIGQVTQVQPLPQLGDVSLHVQQHTFPPQVQQPHVNFPPPGLRQQPMQRQSPPGFHQQPMQLQSPPAGLHQQPTQRCPIPIPQTSSLLQQPRQLQLMQAEQQPVMQSQLHQQQPLQVKQQLPQNMQIQQQTQLSPLCPPQTGAQSIPQRAQQQLSTSEKQMVPTSQLQLLPTSQQQCLPSRQQSFPSSNYQLQQMQIEGMPETQQKLQESHKHLPKEKHQPAALKDSENPLHQTVVTPAGDTAKLQGTVGITNPLLTAKSTSTITSDIYYSDEENEGTDEENTIVKLELNNKPLAHVIQFNNELFLPCHEIIHRIVGENDDHMTVATAWIDARDKSEWNMKTVSGDMPLLQKMQAMNVPGVIKHKGEPFVVLYPLRMVTPLLQHLQNHDSGLDFSDAISKIQAALVSKETSSITDIGKCLIVKILDLGQDELFNFLTSEISIGECKELEKSISDLINAPQIATSFPQDLTDKLQRQHTFIVKYIQVQDENGDNSLPDGQNRSDTDLVEECTFSDFFGVQEMRNPPTLSRRAARNIEKLKKIPKASSLRSLFANVSKTTNQPKHAIGPVAPANETNSHDNNQVPRATSNISVQDSRNTNDIHLNVDSIGLPSKQVQDKSMPMFTAQERSSVKSSPNRTPSSKIERPQNQLASSQSQHTPTTNCPTTKTSDEIPRVVQTAVCTSQAEVSTATCTSASSMHAISNQQGITASKAGAASNFQASASVQQSDISSSTQPFPVNAGILPTQGTFNPLLAPPSIPMMPGYMPMPDYQGSHAVDRNMDYHRLVQQQNFNWQQYQLARAHGQYLQNQMHFQRPGFYNTNDIQHRPPNFVDASRVQAPHFQNVPSQQGQQTYGPYGIPQSRANQQQ